MWDDIASFNGVLQYSRSEELPGQYEIASWEK